MRHTITKIFLVIGLIMTIGCETTDLNLQDNPNELGPESADPNFILNKIQLNFNDIFNGMNEKTMPIVRMEHLYGAYGSYAGSDALNFGQWFDTYAVLKNSNLIDALGEHREISHHQGIAKILKAYTLVLNIDLLNDIPYSEAGDGVNFPQPKTDDAKGLYLELIAELDRAIVLLNMDSDKITSDMFFNGNIENWIKVANTLKLKMYFNQRLIDPAGSAAAINTIVTEGKYIQTQSEDFQFAYSNATTPTDSRHPRFKDNYIKGANVFMSNFYMYLLKDSKLMVDPRLRYYIYRQSNDNEKIEAIPCKGDTGFNFCYIGDYYYGRDHGDDDGIPSDTQSRTIFGAYPFGGAYDNDNFLTGFDSDLTTLEGAGINPIMLSSYVDFMLAETSLTTSFTGDSKAYLVAGITKSMNKVTSFVKTEVTKAAIDSDTAAYIKIVTTEYDAAADDAEKLDIIVREYYLAAFGNGIETYNSHRRTGYPSLIPTNLIKDLGIYPRSFLYPTDEVNSNANFKQKKVTDQVFWDINDADFIN
ncbi:MAG: hypothetical protein COB98_05755 [Flavobacteriaceae bacterium]|nr:MAG: hypothetical protein COB98_05755 [Flavobacteriaceae bacterium]